MQLCLASGLRPFRGKSTRATIGTYPSCLALIRPGNEAAPLALRAQPGRKEQRCCAASAPHSGKTQGARPTTRHQAKPGSETGGRMIRRGEGGEEWLGGPLWSPGGGGVIAFPPRMSTGNRTRATIKALPSPLYHPRPYGFIPPQGRRLPASRRPAREVLDHPASYRSIDLPGNGLRSGWEIAVMGGQVCERLSL